ncbi:MAG TPA: hypothetical protein VFF52_09435 [Isosphaeraceae bacterium]|nr:hypothetical protein [Isosphaeraceae bacterium]
MSLPFLIDEDTRDDALWDAIRVGDEGAPGLETLDPDVLGWSVQTGRIIVSRDASTLIAEHDERVARGTWTTG